MPRGFSPNTVEIGASHGLLLSWVWEPTRYQGGCDYDATRTMHAAARCDGPVLGSIDGTGTDYPARGRSPRRPAARKSPKDRSVSSDRIDTGTEKTGHTNPTRQRGTLAEASA